MQTGCRCKTRNAPLAEKIRVPPGVLSSDREGPVTGSRTTRMTENEIWSLVCAQFYGEDREELVDGLTEEQVIGRVRRARRRYYGGNIHGVVEVPPFSKVTDSAIHCFRFHFVTAHQNPKKPAERILGWAHPALKELLLYNSISLF
ncbi:hypothetical protein PHMEG_00010940 [Phytophthora megakarya]|uniref:Uncharacterized protein n=1 Tax=Phytophthora megakarya TaxID=4795 RepID=A0A225WDV4_9STRA|nr:hypothetical protein PHMEG_00010940 [Phytophthora megakarya]